MDKTEVTSSVIGAAGHTRVLEVRFENGRVYQYYDVPEDIYEGMLNAESKGRYFNQHIRGKYDYQEISYVYRPNRRPGNVRTDNPS